MSVAWKTIDEDLRVEPQVVILKGLPADTPDSYRRAFGRKRLTLGLLAVALMRFIAYGAAVTAHLLIAILFLLLVFSRNAGDEQSDSLVGLAGFEQGQEGDLDKPDDKEALADKKEEAEKAEPEPEPEEVVEEKKPPEPEEKEDVSEKPKEDESTETPDENPDPESKVEGESKEDAPPGTIGTGASQKGTPKPDTDTSKLVEKDPIEAVMAKRKGVLDKLRAGKETDIVVITGGYDSVEKVLRKLGIPYKAVSFKTLADYDLSKAGALLINCDAAYAAGQREQVGNITKLKSQKRRTESAIKSLERKLKSAERTGNEKRVLEYRRQLRIQKRYLSFYDQAIDRSEKAAAVTKNIGSFVEGGGFLFTSDWGLTLIEEALPGYIERGGYVGPKTVPIRPASGSKDHPLMQEVFTIKGNKDRDLDWDIDGSSYLIRKRSSRVETLVESGKLKRYRAVAVTFPHQKGRVLHVLSHFHKQTDNRGDYALQNMLLNFLVQRLIKG